MKDFFSGILDWIKQLFSGMTRNQEEDQEERDALREIALTEQEKKDDRKKLSMEGKILRQLKKIRNELSPAELSIQIKNGGQVVTIDKALLVLTLNMHRMIHTNASIKADEKTLKNFVDYWRVVRHGLMGQKIREGVNRVDLLFKDMGIILYKEEKISQRKIELVKEQYSLIMQEEGVETKRPAEIRT